MSSNNLEEYETYTFKAEFTDNNSVTKRVDHFISEQMPEYTRSRIGSEESQLLVNGKVVKKSKKIKNGDTVTFHCKIIPSTEILPQHINLHFLYEDQNVIVLNKEQGMVVHPAAGNWDGTVANGLVYYAGSLETGNEKYRPGIVHRLDKDTSGVMITSKNISAHEFLSSQFKKRKTKKVYIAIIKGVPLTLKGKIENRIVRDPGNRKKFCCTVDSDRGKPANTEYEVLRTFTLKTGVSYSLIRLIPGTGRTHQLRVHMKSIGHPILGDPIYSRKDTHTLPVSLMLHALSLSIVIPGEITYRKFTAPLPERFKKTINYFIQSQIQQ
ncbi:MAG: RluA family pseudouridine synthase [Spirochaetia bacterium]|nr:RluA family pseudouridine synthase [Spirochaetia bacterium]